MGLTLYQEQIRTIKPTSIKVPKQIADLIKIYCIFYGTTMAEFTTALIECELSDFKKKVDAIKQLGGET